MEQRTVNSIGLTVFTPAYNRAHTLPRTYESLCQQGCKNFIWLVVDDGSTDNTAQLIRQWQSCENGFEIRYIYKENGGMHTAHNAAYEVIDTELNVCIDSDDALAPDAVSTILETWSQVKKESLAGLLGLDADMDGNILGTVFPPDMGETTMLGYYRSGGSGDKKLVLRTDVVRKYPPYPVFEGERLVPLSTLSNQFDKDYTLYPVNKVLCLVEYQADGSTRNMLRQYRRNPRGFRYSRVLLLSTKPKFKERLLLCTHLVAESRLAKVPIFRNNPAKFITALTLPLGLLLTGYIRYKTRNTR